jgi:hypothetical protein
MPGRHDKHDHGDGEADRKYPHVRETLSRRRFQVRAVRPSR